MDLPPLRRPATTLGRLGKGHSACLGCLGGWTGCKGGERDQELWDMESLLRHGTARRGAACRSRLPSWCQTRARDQRSRFHYLHVFTPPCTQWRASVQPNSLSVCSQAWRFARNLWAVAGTWLPAPGVSPASCFGCRCFPPAPPAPPPARSTRPRGSPSPAGACCRKPPRGWSLQRCGAGLTTSRPSRGRPTTRSKWQSTSLAGQMRAAWSGARTAPAMWQSIATAQGATRTC